MKSYGRATTFLALRGSSRPVSVVASIAGDQVAADRVELVLPEDRRLRRVRRVRRRTGRERQRWLLRVRAGARADHSDEPAN